MNWETSPFAALLDFRFLQWLCSEKIRSHSKVMDNDDTQHDDIEIQQDDIEIAQKTIRTFSWKAYAENPDDTLIGSLVVAEENTKLEREPGTTLREQWMQLFDPASRKALKSVTFPQSLNDMSS